MLIVRPVYFLSEKPSPEDCGKEIEIEADLRYN